jgi:hypothetical protein
MMPTSNSRPRVVVKAASERGSSIMLIALLWIAITLARDDGHMSSILAIHSLGLTRIRICM